EVAAKLAPDLGLVQSNLCWTMIGLDRWEEAGKLLPLIGRLDANGCMAASLQAAFAIHDGKLKTASDLLHRAIGKDPHSFYPRAQMGKILLAQGDTVAARESLQEALRCPHTSEDGDEV